MTWQLMPLGIEPPIDPVQYLKGTRPQAGSSAVDEFITSLAQAGEEVEESGADIVRLMTVYDVNHRSIKKLDRADLVVGVTASAGSDEPTFIERRVNPCRSFPLLPAAVIAEIGELHGRRFTNFDLSRRRSRRTCVPSAGPAAPDATSCV